MTVMLVLMFGAGVLALLVMSAARAIDEAEK